MRKIADITISILFIANLSCNDYLDKVPSTSTGTPLESTGQLLALLDNISALMYQQGHNISAGSDDNELPRELFIASTGYFQIDRIAFLTYFVEGISSQAHDPLWIGLYSNIYLANLVITHVDEVTGSAQEKELIRSNAHFLRAYSYWVLVNTYALPYSEANKDSPGVPKKLRTDFEESLVRVPQQEIYNLIEEDLSVAEQTTVVKIDPKLPWRVTKNTVEAFRARLYLHQNQYDKALQYATSALANAPEVLDYNTLGWADSISYPATSELPAQVLNYSEMYKWEEEQFLFWQEWIYPRVSVDALQWYIPSEELIRLYDQQNDLRFDLLYVEHGNRKFNVPHEAYSYSMFGNGMSIITGLTTAEIVLIKAESQIRTGDWRNGLKTLDILRARRYRAGTYTDLSADDQREALRIALAERRREFPFAFRMFDIRRFGVNDTPEDDVSFTRDFFEVSLSGVDINTPKTYVFPVGSPLYTLPINEIEISSSNGEIQQNRY